MAERVLATGRGEDVEIDVAPSRRLVIARPLDAGDVRPGLAIGDITERGAVEAELRESERQLEAAQRIARMGWWRAELDPPRIAYSPTLAGIMGLEVAGDGVGIPDGRLGAALRDGHVGLASSRQRVEAVGGRLDVATRAGAGTRVTAVVPVP